jgi:DNA polymerase-1
MLVGEAPGAAEISSGLPFQGGSGTLLTKMLSNSGISRSDCFLTNLVHVPVPPTDPKWFAKKANQQHILQGMLKLRQDILEIKPNIVVALGAHSLKALTGRTGIDKWRGSILESQLVPGTKVIGTYNPAYILRVYDYKAVGEFDLAKVARQAHSPEIVLPSRRIILPDGEWVRSGVGRTEWEWTDRSWNLEESVRELVSTGEYSVDIECYQTQSGWRLACVGFSCDPSWALVIPAGENPLWRAVIQGLCENPCKKVLQNGTFDVSVLADEGINLQNFYWDTMLAHHTLYAECAGGGDEIAKLQGKKRQAAIAKGLAFLCSVNTDEPFYKDDGKLWKDTGDRRIFYRYNGLDCCVTQESRVVQECDLREQNLLPQFFDTMELVDPLIRATRRGILIDTKKREEMRLKNESELKNLQNFLDIAAGSPLNVGSNKQVTGLLYDKLKLPAKYKKVKGRSTGNRTADADAIVELAGKHKHPVLHAILNIRELRTLDERYFSTRIDSDGRIRCSFDITGTRSYRLSSRASIYGSGTNLQNQPEFIRAYYIADPGKAFVYRDYSQAEVWVVAALGRDEWLLSILQDPTRDIHRETAAVIFGKKPEDVTPAERQLGKKSRHALNYGMQDSRFVEVVNLDAETTGVRIDLALARRVQDGFFALHPNHKSVYWRGVEDELRYSRTLVNGFGYKRTFYGRYDDKLVRDAYSWIPQSTIGVLGRKAWVAIDRAVQPLGGEVLLNVHDSILVQCDVDKVTQVAAAMESAMAIPFSINGYTLTVPTDCKVGYNWGNMGKDGSNPNGLRDIKKFLASPEKVHV